MNSDALAANLLISLILQYLYKNYKPQNPPAQDKHFSKPPPTFTHNIPNNLTTNNGFSPNAQKQKNPLVK